MKIDCSVIRDLLPLYADDVCSPASRQLVEEHLPDCPACADVLRRLRDQEIEEDLRTERDDVLRTQAKQFRRRSARTGAVIAGIFSIPVWVCLIVNLAAGAALDWFFIVLAALLVAASLIVVPILMPQNKLLWTFCAFTASLMVLLGVCCLYSRGTWFWVAASACLFGLGVIFLPFVVRARPVKACLGACRPAPLVVVADVILFANLMNAVSLHSKSPLVTILIAFLCAGGIALLVQVIQNSKGE
jgi:hypothetical protein